MPEIWAPSPQDMRLGQEAYMTYIRGVMLLNHPDRQPGIQEPKELQGHEKRIITHAKYLIWGGLSGVIRYANQKDRRSDLNNARAHYEEALLPMFSFVDE